MNLKKLREAEAQFFAKYPEGWESPELMAIGKKHNMEKIVAFTQASFAKDQFNNPDLIVDNMAKLVSKSTMVSLFEKPKFKDFTRFIAVEAKDGLSHGLYEFLHGNQPVGFEMMVEILEQMSLAKWTLVTVFGAYYSPEVELFIKPTTTKNVLTYFEIRDLIYNPKPNWEFYQKYRDYINELKDKADKRLFTSNAAFLGFLMMTCL
ncbi:MAG: hypothetical protein JXQ65_13765 [Candidatus Marinimicrobia bacterium]|nr:hypothetical protein [Candidatus Neomarinimicrobiota bacterium]